MRDGMEITIKWRMYIPLCMQRNVSCGALNMAARSSQNSNKKNDHCVSLPNEDKSDSSE